MSEEAILAQWQKMGWLWIDKDKFIATLDILAKNSIVKFCCQITATGYYVVKLY